MIKKLEKRIRLIVQIPLLLLMVLISAAFFYINYERIMSDISMEINDLSTITNDRKDMGDKGKPDSAVPPARLDGEMQSTRDEAVKPDDTRDKGGDDASQGEDKGRRSYGEDVLYEFVIENGEIAAQTAADASLTDIALSLAQGEEKRGIQNTYFYRTRKEGGHSYVVKLLQSDTLYQSLVNTVLITAIILVMSVLLVVFISVMLSKVTIKPVIKNEERQKAFISDTSHELKTPLAVIAVNADMLETDVGENKWLRNIQTEISGMEKLIGSLLLLLSTRSEGQEDSYTVFDLSVKSEMCVAVFEAMAYERGVTIKSAVQPNVKFYGREDDIEHIISPLIDNAVKHTSDGGSVIFMLLEEKGEAVITVQNEGEPIPQEAMEKIFDRFYRVDKARNRSENRYGLGLPIVKSVAEKYDGRITVKCENGLTAFTVRLKNNHR